MLKGGKFGGAGIRKEIKALVEQMGFEVIG